MRKIGILSLLLLSAMSSHGQVGGDSVGSRLVSDISYDATLSGTFGAGDHTAVWLHSNRYGIASGETNSGYLRGGLFRPYNADSLYKWRYGYGADLAVAANHSSTLIIQQLYVDVAWKKGLLTVGAKEQPLELKDARFSSGGQTLGVNARPVPEIRLSLPEYWVVPYTKGWLQFKGHIAYGMMTDKNWQHDFTHKQSRYTDNVLYHSKAGYLRIKHADYDYPLSLEAGLQMACQFGGTTYTRLNNDEMMKINSRKNFSAFWHAFIPGGSEVNESGTAFENTEGNNLGSYLLRVNYDKPNWHWALYFEKYFEDQSGMFGVDYDGYGKGDNWNTHKKRKYFAYDFKDMMLGFEFERKNGTWFRNLVIEYLYTKYQSGPVYHDHNKGRSDHVGGNDDFYNHSIYPGWEHWGEAIGSPLYYAPLYNDNGEIRFANNRFTAFHLGVGGHPTDEISYRFLGTWECGLGTYRKPLSKKEHELNFLAECTYTPLSPKLRGWSATAGVGLDVGGIIGDNFGVNVSVRKCGLLTGGKRKKISSSSM